MLLICTTHAEITVKISVDKNEFLEGEPIFCNIRFINNSDNLDSLTLDQLELYSIQIKSAQNKKMYFFGGIGCWLNDIPYKKIEPNQEISYAFNLLSYWGNTKLIRGLHGAAGYLSADNYILKYNYENKLFSNDINLKIIKPIGNEDIVFNTLLKAYQINDGNPWIMDSILLKKNTYYKVVLNHPQSIYWEEAVYRYNEESNWLKLDYTDINVNKEFVKRFPNSYFMRHILINLCQAMYLYEGGLPAVEAYLGYLIENYENYAVSQAAKEQLLKKEYLN